MEPIDGNRLAVLSALDTSSGTAVAASPQATARTIQPVVPGFDPTSLRCAAECRLRELIWKHEDLVSRIKEFCQETDEAKVQERLRLLTDAYRVDEAITPRLFQLGVTLRRVFRLPFPLDIFIQSKQDMNAFCIASRKGNRLVVCLPSGLVNALTPQELLYIMGHEIGHALLRPEDAPSIWEDQVQHFSPLEGAWIRALGRAREISCDRFGLLACQDVCVASMTAFRLATGLAQEWISLDAATAYARHFEDLSAMAELVDLEDAAWRTHPFDSLRVKALVAFSKSETYIQALGGKVAAVPAVEMEQEIEAMLAVLLDPDILRLENEKEEEAKGRFLINGALVILAADGEVGLEQVAWVKAHFDTEWAEEEIAEIVHKMSTEEFREHLHEELVATGHVLWAKLPELECARLFHVMCNVARSGGGLCDPRMEALDQLRQMLHLGHEIASEVLENSESPGSGEDEPVAARGDDGEPAEDTGDQPSLDSGRCSTDLELEDILPAIRQVFSGGGPRDRQAAMREIFRLLPGKRLTPRVRDEIDNALTTAAHRGIVRTEGGLLYSDCRTISDYPRELLKKHLVGVMKGSWWEEEEAIRAAARRLGFGKAGANIQAEFRSAIRGALRQGLL